MQILQACYHVISQVIEEMCGPESGQIKKTAEIFGLFPLGCQIPILIHLGMDMKQISQGRISDNLYDLGMVWSSLVVFEATQENREGCSTPKVKRSMPKGH